MEREQAPQRLSVWMAGGIAGHVLRIAFYDLSSTMLTYVLYSHDKFAAEGQPPPRVRAAVETISRREKEIPAKYYTPTGEVRDGLAYGLTIRERREVALHYLDPRRTPRWLVDAVQTIAEFMRGQGAQTRAKRKVLTFWKTGGRAAARYSIEFFSDGTYYQYNNGEPMDPASPGQGRAPEEVCAAVRGLAALAARGAPLVPPPKHHIPDHPEYGLRVGDSATDIPLHQLGGVYTSSDVHVWAMAISRFMDRNRLAQWL